MVDGAMFGLPTALAGVPHRYGVSLFLRLRGGDYDG